MTHVFKYYVGILVLSLILCFSIVHGEGLIVNTTLGQVRGVEAADGDYTMFLGIPFGKVNEDNPFGDALPPPEFEGIFEANDDSAICPQEEEFNHTIVGTLDCLRLNIYVPNSASPTNLRPVFVWIFGGGFAIGFYGRFLYGPKFLVRHDIVFVAINYRLGPYGFMCLDIPEVSGNQGLKDQLMALRWIRENIANFGGDPDKITIAGNSAGSMSVDYHIMRKNDGPKLFHQVILQSGTTLVDGTSDLPNDAPLQMAKHLGFETNDIYEAIDFLANVSPLDVIETGFDINLAIGTCIEKQFEGVEAFITEDVATMAEIPAAKDMPIMMGFMNDEFLAAGQAGVGTNGPFIVSMYMAMLFDPLHPDFRFIVENTQKFYFGDDDINDDKLREYIDFMADVLVYYPTQKSLRRFLENDVKNVYFFKFSYDGERNFLKQKENITGGGATHADELGYLFDISYMDEPNPADQQVIDSMTTMWANFVKYSDPTPETSALLPHKWEAITKGSPYHYLELDLQLRVGNRPLRERMTYWDVLFDTYGTAQRNSLDTNGELYKLLRKTMRYS